MCIGRNFCLCRVQYCLQFQTPTGGVFLEDKGFYCNQFYKWQSEQKVCLGCGSALLWVARAGEKNAETGAVHRWWALRVAWAEYRLTIRSVAPTVYYFPLTQYLSGNWTWSHLSRPLVSWLNAANKCFNQFHPLNWWRILQPHVTLPGHPTVSRGVVCKNWQALEDQLFQPFYSTDEKTKD